MIAGYFFQGSGLGNQLHRYIATRVRATDLGVGFGMFYKDDGSGKEPNFKGQSFMDIPWKVGDYKIMKQWHEKKVVENGVDIRGYDPEFNFIEDNTIIDGEFQDERYWAHREKEVGEWLKVEPIDIPDDLCIVNFRGGEYTIFLDLFLPLEYWQESFEEMRKINPMMRFEVHTDDPETARKFFNMDIKIISDMELNWRSLRYAKHAIISNSSFAILPRWLRNGITISPRYWARRNKKTWATMQNYYKRFTYI